ncbi:conserved hypothetical protein [Candidatus Nitrospira nitrosa]|uniref:Uncharacterized protein n=2 Tax=Candidatus Nitrospira nitrosa TaxID=1742972 RepID=A0A0S4L5P6_9BACT|nr:conserved hypothetical protein [Candidatus Nitrospira nitrosa]
MLHVTIGSMITASTHDIASYRVSFFFGPEPVEGKAEVLACVFNVKKRSWKAGIQVAVEVSRGQLSAIERTTQLTDRLAKCLVVVEPQEQADYQERSGDVFVQAVCRQKLDLQLLLGLVQNNQRIPAEELIVELDQVVSKHPEHLISCILDELGLVP